jgi:hypothetical protein
LRIGTVWSRHPKVERRRERGEGRERRGEGYPTCGGEECLWVLNEHVREGEGPEEQEGWVREVPRKGTQARC